MGNVHVKVGTPISVMYAQTVYTECGHLCTYNTNVTKQ
jgi:hypothetical protein